MTFADMQHGELLWWREYLRRVNALPRLFAIYGFRYLSFFFEQFNNLGRVIDFGSGPVSAAYTADLDPGPVPCVDPLFARYREGGLVFGEAFEAPDAGATGDYDTALVFNVLDHTDDPAGLLRQVGAAVKPGGFALVWVHVDAEPDTLHRQVTQEQVWEWLRAAGFIVVRSLLRRRWHGPMECLALAERQAVPVV